MKILTITLAAAAVTLTLGWGGVNTNSTELNHGAEQLLACHWFPICRDPDFKNENHDSLDDALQSKDGFELKEAYACHWFPICRDPDMPFLSSDEQSEAAVA
ncbi:hypothetical protein QWY20_06490 [Alkalimonas sp. MEB108]|uniref:Uncharacterized protein n=1 Tax=Alkalimonas cellulosilytica TaxID=3058395 RepID=A0ABU7J3Y8_9GAMM|nr:hypothetical protein [Alkalimonas sp. MEB108]MEE2001097.1 hypothetical protein [Alkalimonas sp. MEB108]